MTNGILLPCHASLCYSLFMFAFTLAFFGVDAFLLLAMQGLCCYDHSIVIQKRAKSLCYNAYLFFLLFSCHIITSQNSYCLHYMQDEVFNSLFQRVESAYFGTLYCTEYFVFYVGYFLLQFGYTLLHILSLCIAVSTAFVLEYRQILL